MTAHASYEANSDRLVPNFDAKLDASYRYAFNSHYDLTLEVGYEMSQYFNAIELLKSSSGAINYVFSDDTAATPVFTPGTTASRTSSDFSSQGPYASLVLHL